MKKIFFMLVAIMQVVAADWKLNVIYNESDLKLDGAYRLKEGGKRKSTYLDKKIKAAVVKPVIMIDYLVVTQAQMQGYLCIVAQNPVGEKCELFFDSQPAHALQWQRMKTTHIGVEKNQADILDDTSLYARVFLKCLGVADVQTKYSYQDDAVLDLHISGKDGKYSLKLVEPVV